MYRQGLAVQMPENGVLFARGSGRGVGKDDLADFRICAALVGGTHYPGAGHSLLDNGAHVWPSTLNAEPPHVGSARRVVERPCRGPAPSGFTQKRSDGTGS